MRIFAPAWGNSSLTGDARASYLVEALTVSQALVEGLGGYVLVNDAETLAGGSRGFRDPGRESQDGGRRLGRDVERLGRG